MGLAMLMPDSCTNLDDMENLTPKSILRPSSVRAVPVPSKDTASSSKWLSVTVVTDINPPAPIIPDILSND